ncbi:ATP-binding cassette domain-containing protein [Candidatus Saccharibacteria bacterium]|nr:ATP-binding cassette domain-containing protein [Candidatus Saccharibacteria bacterium]
MLNIKDLTVRLAGKEILNRLCLTVEPGDIVVVMGPNGAGKSTLARAIMGLEKYQGEIRFSAGPATQQAQPREPLVQARLHGSHFAMPRSNFGTFAGLDLRACHPPEKRSQLGIFLSFQEPPAIPGITIPDFLRAITSEEVDLAEFYQNLSKNLALVGLPEDYADRELNVGFSGGEKKKLEMLQLLMLNPQLAVFDEIDSGLDVDTVRAVAKSIKKWHTSEKSAIIITHNSRLIKRLNPNKVAILQNGRIVKTGDMDLALTTLKEGFNG